MTMFRSVRVCVVLAGLVATAPAFSATVPISYSWTSPDGISVVQSDGAGAITPLAVPGSHDFSHTVSATTASSTIPGSVSGTYPNGFEFYDDYVFSVTGATANVITSTINMGALLGISDLQARLFEYSPPPALPYIGPPPLGTLIEAWGTPVSCGTGCSGSVVVLDSVLLNPGTYVLEIRGNISGTVSGSYGGALNLAPIPVPGAVWLLGSGLALFGVLRRRSAT